jgi:membrane protease YdiL (CAAX protease family)
VVTAAASTRRLVPLAVVFEAGLGAAGCALAWRLGVPIASRMAVTPEVALRCLVALTPTLVFLAVALRSSWPPLVRLRGQVSELARELFGAARWWELLAVSVAAGVGEELLFRGALQPLGERWLGPAYGLLAVSVLFGAVHAASATYFVVATTVGLYFGWLAQRFDELVTPMFVHAAYDWAALWVLTRRESYAIIDSRPDA